MFLTHSAIFRAYEDQGAAGRGQEGGIGAASEAAGDGRL